MSKCHDIGHSLKIALAVCLSLPLLSVSFTTFAESTTAIVMPGGSSTVGTTTCTSSSQCGDNNECTNDTCDPARGCQNPFKDPRVSAPTSCTVGMGTCANTGQWQCDTVSGIVSCSAQASPSGLETCNGMDDDCDGQIDDNLVQTCTVPGGEDICGVGTQSCSGGIWSTCKLENTGKSCGTNTCFSGETCQANGTCGGGSQIKDPAPDSAPDCFTRVCEEGSGWMSQPDSGQFGQTCSDGNACTSGDTCQNLPGNMQAAADNLNQAVAVETSAQAILQAEQDLAAAQLSQCRESASATAQAEATNAEAQAIAGGASTEQAQAEYDRVYQETLNQQLALCDQLQVQLDQKIATLQQQYQAAVTATQLARTQLAAAQLAEQNQNYCQGTDVNPNDNNICTIDSCDPASGVKHEPIAVDDNNACTKDSCDSNTGRISNTPIENCCLANADCSDNNTCNGSESCVNHACIKGIAIDESDNNVCTTDACDPISGQVTHIPVEGCCLANADCSDNNTCNGAETCVNKQCVAGIALDSNDNNACTRDSCDPARGVIHENVAQAETCDGQDNDCNGQTDENNVCCGNNRIDSGERCDGAIGVQEHERCDNCQQIAGLTYCGDGQVQSPNDEGINEQCESETGLADHQACDLATCSTIDLPYCGNQIVDAGEACDDGNSDSNDACVDCQEASCGDKVLFTGVELCDTGANNNDEVAGACKKDCTGFVPNPECGDGEVNQVSEKCDDGNQNPNDSCRNDCTEPSCGDGIADAGEACDDGQLNGAYGYCNQTCNAKVPYCGNGEVEAGEQCDDGSENGRPNKCSLTCADKTPPLCGNNAMEPGEDCEVGVTQLADNQECDNCKIKTRQPVCGNEILEEAEECEAVVTALEENKECIECRIVARKIPKPEPEPKPEPGHGPGPGPKPEPKPQIACGNGVVEGEEACDNGDENSDDVVGACKIDCSGTVLHVGRGMETEERECLSEIFDCALTVTLWTPYHDVDAAVSLYPDDYEKQVVVFAGRSEEGAGLGFKTSRSMSPEGNFSFNTCHLPAGPFKKMIATGLNSEDLNDMVAVEGNTIYRYILDLDQALQSRTGDDCLLEPLGLIEGGDDGIRNWVGETGAATMARLISIRNIQSIKTGANAQKNIVGAVELAVGEPITSKAIGFDLFTYNAEGRFDHRFLHVKDFAASAQIQDIQIAPSSQTETPAFSLIVTTDSGAEWIDCQEMGSGWGCPNSIALTEPPLILLDEEEVRARNPNANQPEQGGRGRLMVGRQGAVVEIEEIEEEEAPDEPEPEDDEAGERGRGRQRIRHEARGGGQVERDSAPDTSFNPQGNNAQAFQAWLEPEAQNIIVTQDSALQGYYVVYDDDGQLEIGALPNEVLNADSTLNDILSNETIAFVQPRHPIPILRNNFGGADMFACFDAIDRVSEEKQGTVCSIFHNRNEVPTIELNPMAPEGKKVTILTSTGDPMNDALIPTATLKDAQGEDISSHITHVDNEKVEIDLTGLVAESTVIADVTKSVGKSHGGDSVAEPLSLIVTTTDAGGLSASKSATLSLDGGLIADQPAGPGGGGQVIGATEESETAERRTTYGVRGGGCFGSIAEGGTTSRLDGVSYLLFLLIASIFSFFRFRMKKN